MLAPVFDSLMTLAEGAAGRRIATGNGPTLSKDEHDLIGLFDGPGLSSSDNGLTVSLYCAVRSLRILLARPIGASTARLAA